MDKPSGCASPFTYNSEKTDCGLTGSIDRSQSSFNNGSLIQYLTEKRKVVSEKSKYNPFSSSKKMKCAEEISNEIDNVLLFKHTIYIIPNTNKIFFEYPMFKLYAHKNNYDSILNYMLGTIRKCIEMYGMVEIHVNLQGFSITAADRYKHIIEKFITTAIPLIHNITGIFIYNTPSMIDSIASVFKMFYSSGLGEKIVKYNKEQSAGIIEKLQMIK